MNRSVVDTNTVLPDLDIRVVHDGVGAATLAALVTVAVARGQAQRAVRLLGAAEALCRAVGAPFLPVYQAEHGAALAARAALGEQVFASEWAAGRALVLDQPTGAPTPPAAGPAPARATLSHLSGLTRREIEVLRLIAAGYSNQEIASELALSVRTVERHITNLYGKITARGRADATAYALRHGLL